MCGIPVIGPVFREECQGYGTDNIAYMQEPLGDGVLRLWPVQRKREDAWPGLLEVRFSPAVPRRRRGLYVPARTASVVHSHTCLDALSYDRPAKDDGKHGQRQQSTRNTG